MMLYPNVKKKSTNLFQNIMTLSVVIIDLICIVINKLTTPNFMWAYIVCVSLLYVLFTTIYSIKKHVNIASHVLAQVIAISVLTTIIDKIIGFKGWSIILAVPISVVTGNITMFILTLVSRKRYFKYALYQLVLSLFSALYLIIVFICNRYNVISLWITFGISVFTLIITIILCGRDLKEELKRDFHI